MEKSALGWFELASHDMQTAIIMSKQHPSKLFVEIIGFHCQQSVEKNLKGYLIAVGAVSDNDIPKSHDMQLLQMMCEKHDSRFSHPAIIAACENLSPYSVRTRYPTEHELFNSDIPKALQAAKAVEQFPPIRNAYASLLAAAKAEAQEEEPEDEDEYER